MKVPKFSSPRKTLVLDGYNVIHAIPCLERKLRESLQSARQALIQYCRDYQTGRGDVRKTVIIFDGRQNRMDLPENFYHNGSEIEVIFSDSGQSADDRILEWMETQDSRSLIVVSNDNYVINNVRAQGVSRISTRQFQAAVEKEIPAKPAQSSVLNQNQTEAITEEYKRFLGMDL